MMLPERLIGTVKESKKYIAGNVWSFHLTYFIFGVKTITVTEEKDF